MTRESITYRIEFAPPTDDGVSLWDVLQPAGGGLPTLVGGCPTCGDDCEIEIRDVVAAGGVPQSGDDDKPVAELTRQLICNCRVNHDWPEGVHAGCGRYWFGRLALGQDGTYRLSVDRDTGLWTAATALAAAQADQDKRIQGAAEKWLGAVTALYGLFSLTAVATVKDALAGLSAGSKRAIAAALLTGIVFAATALIFGYRAAYGWPRPVKVDDNRKMLEWHRAYRNHAPEAAKQLQAAVLCALASLAAIAALTLLVWFLPRARP